MTKIKIPVKAAMRICTDLEEFADILDAPTKEYQAERLKEWQGKALKVWARATALRQAVSDAIQENTRKRLKKAPPSPIAAPPDPSSGRITG